MIKKLVFGSVAALALGAVAVTTMGGMSWLDATGLRGPVKQAEHRIRSYWDARVSGDIEAQNRFLHPLQEMAPSAGLLMTEAYTIDELTVAGDEALARLTVQARLKHPVLSSRQRTIELENRWVRYEGEWYKDLAPATIIDVIRHQQGRWTPPTEAPAAGSLLDESISQ